MNANDVAHPDPCLPNDTGVQQRSPVEMVIPASKLGAPRCVDVLVKRRGLRLLQRLVGQLRSCSCTPLQIIENGLSFFGVLARGD
jgi:hypothetical protein